MQIGRTVLRLGHAIVLMLVVFVAGCATRESVITSAETITIIPEVGLLAELGSLSKADAAMLSKTLEVQYNQGVYEEAIWPVYWRDDLKADLVILVPTEDERVQLLKVEVIGTRYYHWIEGTRNGKHFSRGGLEPRDGNWSEL